MTLWFFVRSHSIDREIDDVIYEYTIRTIKARPRTLESQYTETPENSVGLANEVETRKTKSHFGAVKPNSTRNEFGHSRDEKTHSDPKWCRRGTRLRPGAYASVKRNSRDRYVTRFGDDSIKCAFGCIDKHTCKTQNRHFFTGTTWKNRSSNFFVN